MVEPINDAEDFRVIGPVTKYEGRHSILRPPEDDDSARFTTDSNRLTLERYRARAVGITHHIDITTLSVELAFALIVVLGLVAVSATRKRGRAEPSGDKDNERSNHSS